MIDMIMNLIADMMKHQKPVQEVESDIKSIVAKLEQHVADAQEARSHLDSICKHGIIPCAEYQKQKPLIRTYNYVETSILGYDGQRYLLQMEQLGLINAQIREQIITAAQLLMSKRAGLEDLKLITLSVLFRYTDPSKLNQILRKIDCDANHRIQ